MEGEEQLIKDRLQKLVEKMKELGYSVYMIGRAEERVNELQRRDVCDIAKFVQKLIDRVNDKEAYLDILMEGRFAVILARNRFSKMHIEYCEEGSDLKASWNRNTVYFEVTRRRPSGDEWAEQPEASFASADKAENTISRIRGESSQLQRGEINIVVLWSDTVNLLLPDVEEAFQYIRQEIASDPEEYKYLSGILFTEGGGVSYSTMKQFYLLKNDNALRPLKTRLTRKLESLHEQNLKQLQREMEELVAAFKKM